MATPPSNDRASALATREALTTQIGTFPNAYDPSLHLARARTHLGLDYPDLAAGDAYRAVLLTDYVRMFLEQGDLQPGPIDPLPDNSNAEGEEHDEEEGEGEDEDGGEDGSGDGADGADADELQAATHAQRFMTSSGQSLAATERAALALLVDALGRVGCRAEAANYAHLALGRRADNPPGAALEAALAAAAAAAVHGDGGGGHGGPTARRVVYPWNTHEPDRFSAETVGHLNEHAVPRASSAGGGSSSSSSVEVRVVQLPLLGPTAKPLGTAAHLGVFATRDILAGELCLREESALTVVTDPSDGGLCEYCGQRWRAAHGEPPAETLSCERCAEAEAAGIETVVPVWCSAHCRDAAMAQYHPALCARPVAALHRAAHGPPAGRLALAAAAQPGARVYALLLLKSFAMALVQHTHPLELAETKYLYGVPPPSPSGGADLRIGWGWEENVRGPVAILEALGIDVFTGRPLASSSSPPSSPSARGGAPPPGPDWWDTWVVNTLLAKFRGVASGRLDARGHTEAAAAHTIYSLVNHDCRPNVRWECAGIMKFWGVADPGIGDGPGPLVAVRRGQELKSCYCDASLGYRQRREWMMGCLGGCCMCDRCLREEQVDARSGACE